MELTGSLPKIVMVADGAVTDTMHGQKTEDKDELQFSKHF